MAHGDLQGRSTDSVPARPFFFRLAHFELMGGVCAIRAHTREVRLVGQKFTFLLSAFSSEGICRRSRGLLFWVLLVEVGFLECRFGAGPAKATSTLRPKIPKAEIMLKTLWGQEGSCWEGPAYSGRFSSRDLKMIFFAPRAMRLKKNRPWRGPKRAYFLPPGGQNREYAYQTPPISSKWAGGEKKK